MIDALWVKVVGMLQQNWAVVDDRPDGTAAVRFVDDRSRVFDRMAFRSRKDAIDGLMRNGFCRFEELPGAGTLITAPARPFTSGQHPSGAIYSSGRYWVGEVGAVAAEEAAQSSTRVRPVHTHSYRRLVFERTPGETPDYASLYRFGEPSSPAPLLLYVGGAITKAQHASRFHTPPAPIFAELQAALARVRLDRLDVLIAPSPPRGDEPGATVLESFVKHFEEQLVPALEAPTPSALAFVGYSFGAHLATFLALLCERSRALVTIGGAGIAEAAQLVRPAVPADLAVALFHNEGDPLPEPERAVWAFEERLQPRVMPPRPGEHPFGFYAANGTIEDAFAFALEHLRDATMPD